jgi:L-threonylcarbamoyladenylate synthase
MYRPGGISVEELESVLGADVVEVFRPPVGEHEPESMPSPGVGIRHYAPRARLVLVFEPSRQKAPARQSLVDAISELPVLQSEIGVMLPEGWDASRAGLVYRWGPWSDGEMLARRLFAGLRELDERGAAVIVCPVPEIGGIGEAIRDRLRKAARER